jgi:flavin reductase (DIM6/NTAB) family NADH-FMN oxidoreductase RutF
MDVLERGGVATIQFIPPGTDLDRAMSSIANVSDDETGARVTRTGLTTRRAETNAAPVFDSAFMVYEAKLVKPGKDFDSRPIYERAWIDLGSHRVYFLEINSIQLRSDIASGRSQVAWRALPAWEPKLDLGEKAAATERPDTGDRYKKGYAPNYRFPSSNTAAFEADGEAHGMKIKHLAPLPADQVEVDNDRARWPCFFPSAAGIITTWAGFGAPNLMPCGSTTILSRHPLVVAIAVSYAAINQRYAPRATLDILRKTKRFGCGVPFINDTVLDAIRYAGNTSFATDPKKVANSGLAVKVETWMPVLPALPVQFECEVIGEERLGTHILFLGEVRRVLVRADVTPQNPLEWCPWAAVVPNKDYVSVGAKVLGSVQTGIPTDLEIKPVCTKTGRISERTPSSCQASGSGGGPS